MSLPNQPRRIEMECYSLRNMYLSLLITNLSYLTVGMTLVWTSPTLPYLRQLLLLSQYEEACIAASCFFGAALGPIIGGQLVDRFGYKSVMLAHSVLYSTSLLLLIFSSSVVCLVVGRMVAGIATGMILRYVPDYVMEIADPEVYNTLSPISLPTLALGYLVAYAVGPPQLTYHQLLWLYTTVPVVSLGSGLWLPESARYDVSRGKLDHAEHTISFLRRGISTRAAQAEILFLQEKVSREPRVTSQWHSLLSESAEVRALAVVVGLSALQQLSGTPVVLTLTQDLLTKSGAMTNTNLPTLVIGVVVFIISIFIPVFTRSCTYKKVLTCSAVQMAISMVVFGFYFSDTKKIDGGSQHTAWILLSCILIHLAGYQTGFANICLNIETYSVFSPTRREVTISTAMTVMFFFSSVTVFTFCLLDFPAGSAIAIWIFAFFCVITAFVSALYVPNTLRFHSQDTY